MDEIEKVNDINQKVREMSIRLADNQDEFFETFKEEVEHSSLTLFELEGVSLRQVINRKKNEQMIKGNQDLARMYDHV